MNGVRLLLLFYTLILTTNRSSVISPDGISVAVDVNNLMRDMNPCIPAGRRTLAEHTDSGDLTFRTKDGSVCQIGKDEIDLLSDVCTEQEKTVLRLPIFVSTDVHADGGAWKVDGTVESEVVARILGRSKFRPDTVRLYNPDLGELRRLLPNATFIVFLP